MHKPPTTSAGNDRRGVPRPIWLLIGSCLASISVTVVGPSLTVMLDEFHDAAGTDALVPFVTGAPVLAMLVFSPIVGKLIDRDGRSYWIPAGLTLYSVAGMAPLVLDSLPAIVVSRLFVGVATAMVVTACTVLLGDAYTGERRARGLALIPLFLTLSGSIGLTAGTFLTGFGWRAPYAVLVIGVLLLPALAHTRRLPARSDSRPKAIMRSGPAPVPSSPASLLVLTVVASAVVALPLVYTYLLVALTGFVSPAMITAIATLNCMAMLAGGIAGREVVDSRPDRVLATGFGVAALGFGIIGAGPGLPGVLLGVVVIAGLMMASFGSGLIVPMLLVRTVGALDEEERGYSVGLWQAAYFLGQFVTPVAFTTISLMAGGAFAGLAAIAFMALAAAVTVAVAARRRAPDRSGSDRPGSDRPGSDRPGSDHSGPARAGDEGDAPRYRRGYRSP